MKLLILQLSDIHLFAPGTNVVMDRAAAVANAAHSAMPDANAVLIALVGDLAYHGTSEEYSLMRMFLSVLLDTYRGRNTGTSEILIAAVPGNHDCYFGDDDQTARDTLLSGLKRESILKPSVFQTLIQPQRAFFEFMESGLGVQVVHPARDPLTVHVMKVGGVAIEIVCLNTALCTRFKELPGTLELPPLTASESLLPVASASVSVVLAHHPPHWLRPESYHDVRKFVIERNALLLTGHEHQPSLWTAGEDGRLAQLVEGGVLQETHNTVTSSFHVLSLDTDAGELAERTFKWNHNVYVGSDPRQLAWTRASAPSTAVKLSLQVSHASFLEDLGGVITHPERNNLSLSDVFIMPHLKHHAETVSKSKDGLIIKPDHVYKTLLEHHLVQISGGSRTGKTAFAKRLFYELWASGMLPLFVNGDILRSASSTKIRQKLEEALRQNYRINHPDEYFASQHDLVLIIDDFDKSGLNRRGQDALLAYVRGLFKHVIVFERVRPMLEDIVDKGSLLSNLRDVTQFELMPLRAAGRAEFVEKWVLLGKTPADSESDVRAEVLETTRLVETLLGRDLVPRTPFYLLSVLSSLQQVRQPAADLGSLGYLYELMIRTSLARATRHPEMMQTLDGFLSDLAFSMYKSQRHIVTREEFKAKCAEYASRCLIEFDDKAAEDVLCKAMIIKNESGQVLFKYKYIYYFFVAKYLSQRLSTNIMQDEVRRLSSELHKSEYANVLLFLCHCTSDPIIIDCMVGRADELFSGTAEVNLEEDCVFLNELDRPTPKLSLGSAGASENHKRMLEEHDVEEQNNQNTVDRNDGPEMEIVVSESPRITEDDVGRFRHVLTSSFKTIEIAGQVLRNHPTISGTDKLRLIKACTSLTRRMIKSMLDEMRDNASELIGAIEKSLAERTPGLEPGKAKAISNMVFQLNIEGIVLSIVKAHATHFGMIGLAPAFRRLRAEVPDKTVMLMDLAVQMENPRQFPETSAMDVERLYKGNMFVWSCIRDMVFLYYYLFVTSDRAQRQRICDTFKIDYQAPELLSKEPKLNA